MLDPKQLSAVLSKFVASFIHFLVSMLLHKDFLFYYYTFRSILEKAKIEENVEFMDVDDIEKFHHEMFDVPVTVQHVKEFDFYHEDIFIGCNFSDCDFIRCFKNSNLSAWILEAILLKASGTKMSELASSSFLELPVVPVFTKGILKVFPFY